MEYMHELKEMLCDELEEIAEKGELTAGSLDTIDKLTHSIKSIATIMAMEDADYSYDDMGGMDRGSYRGSYAQRRDSRGRYSRRRMGRYSRDEEADKMVMKLEKMMNESSDPKTKNAIQQAISAIDM